MDRLLRLPWWGWTVFCFWMMFLVSAIFHALTLFGWKLGMLFEIVSALLILTFLGCAACAVISKLTKRTAERQVTKRWIKRANTTGVCAFLIGLIAVTIPAVNQAQQTAEIAEQEAQDSEWVPYSTSEGAFTFQLPLSWQQQQPSPIPGTTYFVHPREDLHLMSSTVSRTDVTYRSLEELQDVQLQQLTQALIDSQVSVSRTTTQNGLPSVTTRVVGSIEQQRFCYGITYVESPTQWGELKVWTTPSQYARHEEMLSRILSSIQIAEEPIR